MPKDKSSRSVYSTDTGRLCPECENPIAACSCRTKGVLIENSSNQVYLHLERKGRGGKVVTVIKQLALNQLALQLLAKELKIKCGSGGTVSNGNIEIQGEHRDALKDMLEAKGYRVKYSGS